MLCCVSARCWSRYGESLSSPGLLWLVNFSLLLKDCTFQWRHLNLSNGNSFRLKCFSWLLLFYQILIFNILLYWIFTSPSLKVKDIFLFLILSIFTLFIYLFMSVFLLLVSFRFPADFYWPQYSCIYLTCWLQKAIICRDSQTEIVTLCHLLKLEI